jgi:RND family efflux transporter MFP subunit
MEKILKTWLFQQCQILSGSIQAILLAGRVDEGPYDRALFWPEQPSDHSSLTRIAQAALRCKQPVIKTRNSALNDTGEPLDTMACPLFINGLLLGVVAIEMTHRSQPMQQAAIQQVQAGAQWLETMITLQDSTTTDQLVNLVDLVAAALNHDQFRIAATEVTNELAARFNCQRVSLGFVRYNHVRIEAMSHSAKVDQHSNLVRAIRDAMDEALDQSTTIVYPLQPEFGIVACQLHAQLSSAQQGASICTVPLIKTGKIIGALLLERKADQPFTPQTVVHCERIGLLIGPVLETRRRDERPLAAKVLTSLQRLCLQLFGPHYLPLKLIVTFSTALLLWMSQANSMFYVSSDSMLEAVLSRAIVAPQQGYIAAAHVRAGDLVHKGDLMATLDDQDLQQQRRKWQSQRTQLLKEHRQALASFDRAEIAILTAKRGQAEAQLRMVEQQLARTTLVAPFSGLVVNGDLSQALGSPVSPGQVLFEVAPTGEYRVVQKVDDRDIGLVAAGQRGQLKLSGISDLTYAITIDRITPVATSENGRNYFRVEAVIDDPSDLMRPGMEGISKIEISQKKLLWIWTRRFVDWLQLFVWKQLP